MTIYSYDAIDLGTFRDLDPSDGGNIRSEQAGRLLNQTFGSAGDPLYDHRTAISLNDVNSDGTILEDIGTKEPLLYPGSVNVMLDSTIVYQITITYAGVSGLPPATINATLVQGSDGQLFLLGDNLAAFEAGAIESVTFNSIVDDALPGLAVPRQDTDFLCFAKGTLIRTPSGPVPVETLRPGDLVETLDHGPQPLRWTGSREVPALGRLAPVRIAKGALENSEDLVVSPQHRILVSGPEVALRHGEDEALVPAIGLINGGTIRQVAGGTVHYFHLMFDRHEIISANGVSAESLFLGGETLRMLSPQERDEIAALFPELLDIGAPSGILTARAARIVLKPWEARGLT